MKKEILSRLRKRALALAKEPPLEREDTSVIELVEFTLAAENYGIESRMVREIYPLKDFTPLPGVPSYILGIVNIRGSILPIVDLRIFFNLPEKGLGELNRVIILHDEQMEFGILADKVEGIRVIYDEEILPVPQNITRIGEEYLKGITKNRIIIIDANKLLRDKNLIVNDRVN